MKKAKLVFIPSPGISHLASTVEIAKILADRDHHLSISVIIMKFPFDTKVSEYTKSLSPDSSSCINLIELIPEMLLFEASSLFMYKFIDYHKGQVRDFLAKISTSEDDKLSGVVVDMFCTSMIDVANEFDVPSYVFYTSGASFLGLAFHFQSLKDDLKQDVITQYEDSNAEFSIPSYKNPVPCKVLPSLMLEKDGGLDAFLYHIKRFRETKGIIINTFLELEPHAIEVLTKDETIPPVYTGGPILSLKNNSTENPIADKIMKWLDLQPEKSVVFLCFGSYGFFSEAQVKEIAHALEGSGHRFLWSLRKPPGEGQMEGPGEYDSFEEVLPEGFLQRTVSVGMVIGWAPQVAVLAHSAIGGFVSHCGWNSLLESLWFGVPTATWPLYAEQQANAFELIKDLGLAVEIKMDYKKDFKNRFAEEIVSADVIEDRIRILMDPKNGIRKNVEEMKEKSRLALEKGGSSHASLKDFIDCVIKGL